MKRIISIVILFAMLLTIGACQSRPNAPTDDPAKATEASVTAEPSAEPTEEPTEAPTEAPTETPEPTATPAPEYVPFEDCAEVAVRLPWGDGDNEAFIEDPENFCEGIRPMSIFFGDNKIYILDRYFYPNNRGILTCDLESGETGRIDVNSQFSVGPVFAVNGSKIITPRLIYNYETGEEKLLQETPLPLGGSVDCYDAIRIRDGKCCLYVSEPEIVGDTEYEDRLVKEYVLDEENLIWQPVREYMCKHRDGIEILESGAMLDHTESDSGPEYIGRDANGHHYTQSYGLVSKDGQDWLAYVITEYSPEGAPLKFTRFSTDPGSYSFWIPSAYKEYRNFAISDDGTLWYMVFYAEELVVFKINL